jgi:hypothetical protein
MYYSYKNTIPLYRKRVTGANYKFASTSEDMERGDGGSYTNCSILRHLENNSVTCHRQTNPRKANISLSHVLLTDEA